MDDDLTPTATLHGLRLTLTDQKYGGSVPPKNGGSGAATAAHATPPPPPQSGADQLGPGTTVAQLYQRLAGKVGSGSPHVGFAAKRYYFDVRGDRSASPPGAGVFPQLNTLAVNGQWGDLILPLNALGQGTTSATRLGNTINLHRIKMTVHLWVTRAKTGATPPVTDYASTTVPNATGTNSAIDMQTWPSYHAAVYKIPFNVNADLVGVAAPPAPFTLFDMTSVGPNASAGVMTMNPYYFPNWNRSSTPTTLTNMPYMISTPYRNPIVPKIFGYLEDERRWEPFHKPRFDAGLNDPMPNAATAYGANGGQIAKWDYDLAFKDHVVTYNPNDLVTPFYPITNNVGFAVWSTETTAMMAALAYNVNYYATGYVDFSDPAG